MAAVRIGSSVKTGDGSRFMPRGRRSPFYRFIWSDPQMALLGELEFDWNDGGCLVLADAVAGWLELPGMRCGL